MPFSRTPPWSVRRLTGFTSLPVRSTVEQEVDLPRAKQGYGIQNSEEQRGSTGRRIQFGRGSVLQDLADMVVVCRYSTLARLLCSRTVFVEGRTRAQQPGTSSRQGSKHQRRKRAPGVFCIQSSYGARCSSFNVNLPRLGVNSKARRGTSRLVSSKRKDCTGGKQKRRNRTPRVSCIQPRQGVW